MESLLQVVNKSTATAKLLYHTLDAQLSVKVDIEAYLLTFERITSALKIQKDQWHYHLTPQLTGKAQLALQLCCLPKLKIMMPLKLLFWPDMILMKRYTIIDFALQSSSEMKCTGSY